MPELPEVETVCRQLRDWVVGREIAEVELLHPKITRGQKDFSDRLAGLTITALERRAKLMIFRTSDPEVSILAHLKMTGQFLYQTADDKLAGGGHTLSKTDLVLPHKHTRLVYHFANGDRLHFNDMRLFGYNVLASEVEVQTALEKFGIEPGLADYTWENFQKIFHQQKDASKPYRKVGVKSLLLDQSVIAGLGNIYVDEALFRARVHPERLVVTLNQREKKALFRFAKMVIDESIKRGGTTFYSFIDSRGEKGNYSEYLEVFDRTGQPCIACDTTIEKIRVATRGTHFCPQCQEI